MGIGTKILNFFPDQKGWIPVHDKNLYSPSPWVLFFFLWNGKVHRCPTIQFCFSNSVPSLWGHGGHVIGPPWRDWGLFRNAPPPTPTRLVCRGRSLSLPEDGNSDAGSYNDLQRSAGLHSQLLVAGVAEVRPEDNSVDNLDLQGLCPPTFWLGEVVFTGPKIHIG